MSGERGVGAEPSRAKFARRRLARGRQGFWVSALLAIACGGGDDGKSAAGSGGVGASLGGAAGALEGSGGATAGTAGALAQGGRNPSGSAGTTAGGNSDGRAGGAGSGAGSGGDGRAGSAGSGAGGSSSVVPKCLKSVALGDAYLCVVDGDGALACRGKNDSGQLGIGGAGSSDTFRAVSGFDGPVTSLWTSFGETYAITETGKVFRWGYVDFLTRDDVVPKPVDYSAHLSKAKVVLGGASHHCALNTDMTLVCWGANNFNQLGDGSTGHVEPSAVPGLDSLVDLAVAYEHSCAVKSDGTLWCWGDNSVGQLGIGTTDQVTAPTAVAGLGANVEQVAAHYEYSCALTSDGKVSCWGKNGDHDLQGTPTPTLIDALGADVKKIAVGDAHVCALKTSGELWCWSLDLSSSGKLPAVASKTPAPVTELGTDVTEVWAGYFSTCAQKKDGSVWCWGSDLSFNATPQQLAAGCN